MKNTTLKDGGTRRRFETGAVREIPDDRGRCDLLPLDVVATMIHGDPTVKDFLDEIHLYQKYVEIESLFHAISRFISFAYDGDSIEALLDVSKQYAEGAKKYGEDNWKKGIPVHCYIDSAIRHYLKFLRGDNDEPHARAVLWNLMGAIWTHLNHPEMNDMFSSKDDLSDW